jgi:hypothetical protein
MPYVLSTKMVLMLCLQVCAQLAKKSKSYF